MREKIGPQVHVFGRYIPISENRGLHDVGRHTVDDLETFRDRLIELASLANDLGLDATWMKLECVEDGIGDLITSMKLHGEQIKWNFPFDWTKYRYMCDRDRFEDNLGPAPIPTLNPGGWWE